MSSSPTAADWLVDPRAIETLYEGHIARATAISPHLHRLRHYAEGFNSITEFGMKAGASTCAFLLAARNVLSIDVKPVPGAVDTLKRLAGDAWRFQQGDTRTVDMQPCDLLFVDADHTFDSVRLELDRHADKVHRRLIFHDTITFGSIGADGETGRQQWEYRRGISVPPECLGIRPAIDLLMIRDPSWRIHAHHFESHGLLILDRHTP